MKRHEIAAFITVSEEVFQTFRTPAFLFFISSTFEDLKDVREQIIKCILEMGHIPVGMEMFSAGNEEQKEMDLIKALELNIREIPIKFIDTEKGEWNRDNKISLRQLFEIIAERMLIEADEDELKKAIALGASKRTDYQHDVPVANNRFKEWMADLNALGLIEQSHKNHILADKNQYWSLSENGKTIFMNFRRLKLIQGIIEKPGMQIFDNDEEK